MHDPKQPSDTGLPQSNPPTGIASANAEETTPHLTPPDQPPTHTLPAPAHYDPDSVARAAGTLTTPGDYHPTSMAEMGLTAGRYTLLRELAKGGMGQVSIARDTELDRDIALKEIQPKFKLDGATLHRFTLEARVTGRLEHPGVVPVYGLGAYPDGRPYYAMRFITGKTFQDAIDDFHKTDFPGRDPQERSLALRQLLRRFIDVCNTIGYAHSRGILHRDIKPTNVMLGHYGETLVVDWGLAKEMFEGAARPEPTSKDTVVFPVNVKPEDFLETKEGFTLYGQTMGTPAYMSPEQALGKWDVTGVGSDVYSLGAMLYAVLSGTPPFAGPSYEVLTRVQRGDFKPVKLVKGEVPGPLDAIVRKAMAFEIADRYPNALALAADVEKWLADEPVSCFRDSFSVRAMRWARRNRTKVIAGGLALMTGLAALAVGLMLVNAERRRTDAAKKDAIRSRDQTRDALFAVTDDSVGDFLQSGAKLSPEQLKYLDGLIGKFREFTQLQPDSPETVLFMANAWYRIGRLEARAERYDQAAHAYDESVKLAAEPSLDAKPEAQKLRGDALLYGGILELQQGRPDAEPKLQAAIECFQQLVASDPNPDYRARLAQAQDRLGVYSLTVRRISEAEKLFRESLAGRKALAAEFPKNAEYAYRVAQSGRMLAGAAFAVGNVAEGRTLMLDARKVTAALVEQNQRSPVYLRLLADIDTELAAHFAVSRRSAAIQTPTKDSPAVPYARTAADTWSRLANLFPGDSLYAQRQAEANINLALQYQANRQTREALAALDATLAILAELEEKHPGLPVTQLKRVQALVLRANVLQESKASAARTVADEAVKAADVAANALPASGEAQAYAADAHCVRARVKLAAKDAKGARADVDAAWPFVQKAAAGYPSFQLQPYVQAAADVLDAQNDFAAAAAIGRAIAALPLANGQAHFEAACFHGRLARHLNEKPEDAVQHMAVAVNDLRAAVKAGFTNVDLLETDPDLAEPRRTNEFREIAEQLRAKPAPKRRDT